MKRKTAIVSVSEEDFQAVSSCVFDVWNRYTIKGLPALRASAIALDELARRMNRSLSNQAVASTISTKQWRKHAPRIQSPLESAGLRNRKDAFV